MGEAGVTRTGGEASMHACAELLERYYADRLAEFSRASGLWSGPDDEVDLTYPT